MLTTVGTKQQENHPKREQWVKYVNHSTKQQENHPKREQ